MHDGMTMKQDSIPINRPAAFFFYLILYVDIYLILGCKTVNGKKCIFPFLYQWGEEYYFEYNRCTTYGNSGKFWCATKVDGQGYWLEEDDCAGCPGEEHLLHIMLVSALNLIECIHTYHNHNHITMQIFNKILILLIFSCADETINTVATHNFDNITTECDGNGFCKARCNVREDDEDNKWQCYGECKHNTVYIRKVDDDEYDLCCNQPRSKDDEDLRTLSTEQQINRAKCLKIDDINKKNSQPIYCEKSPWTCSVGTEIIEQNEAPIP